MSDWMLIPLAFLLGIIASQFTGGWVALACAYLRRKHEAIWIDIRFATPFGADRWGVSVMPFKGEPYYIGRSSVRGFAIIDALFTPRRPTSTTGSNE